MTAAGFTLVVAALIIMLAFINGVQTVSAVTGEPENVIVLADGNTDEVMSSMDHRLVYQVESTPGILRNSNGQLLASREMFMVIVPANVETAEISILQARGVTPLALEVHTNIKIVEGRMFRRHQREVIVGAGFAREQKIKVGEELQLGLKMWRVVGKFAAQGSTLESEVWCDLNQLAGQFHREGEYSTVVFRTRNALAAEEAVNFLGESKQFDVEALPEMVYYQQQAEQTNVIRVGAIVIAIFMSVGTVLGVTNTMFAAIGARTKDIAVMRLMGFGRIEILLSFLIEALLIALAGGLLGSMLGYTMNGLTLNTAMGAKQIAFAFKVDLSILMTGAFFTLGMGLIGGLLPALSAMRVSPLQALR